MAEPTNERVDSSSHHFPPPPAVYTLRLVEVRSYPVLTQRAIRARSGSLEELMAFARKLLIRNLLLGWWASPWSGSAWTDRVGDVGSDALPAGAAGPA